MTTKYICCGAITSPIFVQIFFIELIFCNLRKTKIQYCCKNIL
nr:MAG TPA: hypothetical protein [Caudoviricetes sp.]